MIIELYNGSRGSGRTTKMLSEVKQYALNHPDHRIMVFAHDSSFARTLESWYRKLGMDSKNIAFNAMPIDMSRVNERVWDKYFIDHHAEYIYFERLIARANYDFQRVFGNEGY